jgi:Holliday junction resolvase RusA-like endonuclease
MQETIIIEDMKIPSINEKYGFNTKSKKMYLNENYRTFKEYIAHLVKIKNIPSPYMVIISWKTYHDIDNAVKCILDGLKLGRCIDDDKNVLELHMRKIPAKKGEKNDLSIIVKSLCARGEL